MIDVIWLTLKKTKFWSTVPSRNLQKTFKELANLWGNWQVWLEFLKMWRNAVKMPLYCNTYCGSTITSYPDQGIVCLVRCKPQKIHVVCPWFSCCDGKLMLSRISFLWERCKQVSKFSNLFIQMPHSRWSLLHAVMDNISHFLIF